ncbi:hypothetical protein JCM5350_004575 [Sporobolomyces pararoseus]
MNGCTPHPRRGKNLQGLRCPASDTLQLLGFHQANEDLGGAKGPIFGDAQLNVYRPLPPRASKSGPPPRVFQSTNSSIQMPINNASNLHPFDLVRHLPSSIHTGNRTARHAKSHASTGSTHPDFWSDSQPSITSFVEIPDLVVHPSVPYYSPTRGFFHPQE